MKHPLTEKALFGGIGGQGINLMGKLLARAAMDHGYQVTLLSSYGGEVRGGVSLSMVVMSRRKPSSSHIVTPDSVVAMSDMCLGRYEGPLNSGGLLLVNTSVVEKKPVRKDITVMRIDAGKIAEESGDWLVQNMVMLGDYVRMKGLIPADVLVSALKSILPERRKSMFEMNAKAITGGMKAVESLL